MLGSSPFRTLQKKSQHRNNNVLERGSVNWEKASRGQKNSVHAHSAFMPLPSALVICTPTKDDADPADSEDCLPVCSLCPMSRSQVSGNGILKNSHALK